MLWYLHFRHTCDSGIHTCLRDVRSPEHISMVIYVFPQIRLPMKRKQSSQSRLFCYIYSALNHIKLCLLLILHFLEGNRAFVLNFFCIFINGVGPSLGSRVSHSTLIYTLELILCSTICVHSATRHNIYMYRYFLLSAFHHLSRPLLSLSDLVA